MKKILCLICLLSIATLSARSHHQDSFQMDLLVKGSPAPKYYHGGKVYVEALKNQEYSIRLTNPLNRRVAVALAVDGLNSIDAQTTKAWAGKKWVLQPFETITISGWQVNQSQARRFFFTTEEKSYGQWLGKTQNLGVITAVFFQERVRLYEQPPASRPVPRADSQERKSSEQESNRQESRDSAGAASEAAPSDAVGSRTMKKEDYAATGIGERMQHDVQWVSLDLDPAPVATLNLRYEFRPVLVSMGILPASPRTDPLSRREQARGFTDSRFCPEPR